MATHLIGRPHKEVYVCVNLVNCTWGALMTSHSRPLQEVGVLFTLTVTVSHILVDESSQGNLKGGECEREMHFGLIIIELIVTVEV